MQHTLDVLERIELSNFFDEIYDIKMANYIPKPELAPYEQMIKQFDINTESFPVLSENVDISHSNMQYKDKMKMLFNILIKDRNSKD